MATGKPPVCNGQIHRWEAVQEKDGPLILAEFAGDDPDAFKRMVAPTAGQIEAWLTHAFQAGRLYEASLLEDFSEDESGQCPVCEFTCACSESAKTLRELMRAPDVVPVPAVSGNGNGDHTPERLNETGSM